MGCSLSLFPQKAVVALSTLGVRDTNGRLAVALGLRLEYLSHEDVFDPLFFDIEIQHNSVDVISASYNVPFSYSLL